MPIYSEVAYKNSEVAHLVHYIAEGSLLRRRPTEKLVQNCFSPANSTHVMQFRYWLDTGLFSLFIYFIPVMIPETDISDAIFL